jgi:hypothetical protein
VVHDTGSIARLPIGDFRLAAACGNSSGQSRHMQIELRFVPAVLYLLEDGVPWSFIGLQSEFVMALHAKSHRAMQCAQRFFHVSGPQRRFQPGRATVKSEPETPEIIVVRQIVYLSHFVVQTQPGTGYPGGLGRFMFGKQADHRSDRVHLRTHIDQQAVPDRGGKAERDPRVEHVVRGQTDIMVFSREDNWRSQQ